jgi:hypothetical protein
MGTTVTRIHSLLSHGDGRRKKWLILCLGAGALALFVVLTGGPAVSHVDDFGGQRDIHIADDLEADIWVEPQSTSFGCPFVLHYYNAGKPFAVRLQIWDTKKRYEAIEIADIVIEYKDGEVFRRGEPWLRQLKPLTQYNSSTGGGSFRPICLC